MTDRELRRLRRSDLLEMLLEAEKRNEALTDENRRLTEQMESREICISKAGSIAEAALQLSGIFEAAQNAAGQYLDSIRRIEKEAMEKAEAAGTEAGEKAEAAGTEAGEKAEEAGEQPEGIEAEERHE